MPHTRATFRYLESLHLTCTVLHHHTHAAQTQANELKHLFSIICQHHPHLLPSIHSTLLAAQHLLNRLSGNQLHKLISSILLLKKATVSAGSFSFDS